MVTSDLKQQDSVRRLPAVLLMGPTASGKTDLAMALADQFPCDIISVDSVMVYRGMDIGSAKPSPELLAKYPHQLVDIRDPAEPYSAADFQSDASAAIQASHAGGRVPLLVGGTMMYYRALLSGIADMPSASPEVRRQLEQEAAQLGWPTLHQRLEQLDPLAAGRIHPNNRQRVQRALEVCLTTGKPFSSFWGLGEDSATTRWEAGPSQILPFEPLSLAITPPDKETLWQRISARFHSMLAQGLIEEVETLFAREDLNEALPSIRAVGYRQVWQYLAGDIARNDLAERGIIATRQLAKRQLTWLRRWENLTWLSGDEKSQVQQGGEEIQRALQSCNWR